MSIKKRKTRVTKKYLLLISALIFLLVIGLSYAYYSDMLQLNASVTTGALDVCFSDGSKNVNIGTITLIKYIDDDIKDNEIDDDTITVDTNNTAYEFEIVDKSTLPTKTSIINNEGIATAVFEDSKIKLDLSGFLNEPSGTYDLNLQIIFDQYNSNGGGFWNDALTVNGTIIVEENIKTKKDKEDKEDKGKDKSEDNSNKIPLDNITTQTAIEVPLDGDTGEEYLNSTTTESAVNVNTDDANSDRTEGSTTTETSIELPPEAGAGEEPSDQSIIEAGEEPLDHTIVEANEDHKEQINETETEGTQNSAQ